MAILQLFYVTYNRVANMINEFCSVKENNVVVSGSHENRFITIKSNGEEVMKLVPIRRDPTFLELIKQAVEEILLCLL